MTLHKGPTHDTAEELLHDDSGRACPYNSA